VATVFILLLLCIPGPASLLMMTVCLLGFPIAAVVLLTTAAVLAAKKRPRGAASVFLALIVSASLFYPLVWVADCAHAALTVWFGVGELGAPSKTDPEGFAVYDWSTGLVGGANTFLIHDPTDRIALPSASRPQLPKDELGLAEICGGKAVRLLGHYYICTF
jgi:hypothetical protein